MADLALKHLDHVQIHATQGTEANRCARTFLSAATRPPGQAVSGESQHAVPPRRGSVQTRSSGGGEPDRGTDRGQRRHHGQQLRADRHPRPVQRRHGCGVDQSATEMQPGEQARRHAIATAVEQLGQRAGRARRDDQARAVRLGQQQGQLIGGKARRKRDRRQVELHQPGRAETPLVRGQADHQLRPAPQRSLRDRLHVADDQVWSVARGEQHVGAAIDADENRRSVADERRRAQPGPHRGRTRGSPRRTGARTCPCAPAARRRRRPTTPNPRPGAPAHRPPTHPAVRPRPPRHRPWPHTPRPSSWRTPWPSTTSPTSTAVPSTVTSSPSRTCWKITSPRSSSNGMPAWANASGPRFGYRPGARRLCVHDGRDPGGDEGLSGGPVEVGVVDERDVAGAQPAGEATGAPVEPGRAGDRTAQRSAGHARGGRSWGQKYASQDMLALNRLKRLATRRAISTISSRLTTKCCYSRCE